MPKVTGESDQDDGVLGQSIAAGKAGVAGVSVGPQPGNGVYGRSDNGGSGVWGHSPAGNGVSGLSDGNDGVLGQSIAAGKAGVAGVSVGAQPGNGVYGSSDNGGSGVYGRSMNGHAGWFDGNVHVTQSLIVDGDVVLSNADCAEEFDIAEIDIVEPGTVMVLGEEGGLKPSDHAYDRRVVGVVSGAGGYKPGIVLDKQPGQTHRLPIALLGKVYCKADARFAPIAVGDLLTTSETPGCAMKACDPTRAFGSVIGKALRSLPNGQGLIPVLIALH